MEALLGYLEALYVESKAWTVSAEPSDGYLQASEKKTTSLKNHAALSTLSAPGSVTAFRCKKCRKCTTVLFAIRACAKGIENVLGARGAPGAAVFCLAM